MTESESHKELLSNRKARFQYEILETFEVGIALQGTEVKALRQGGGSLQEAFIDATGSELLLIGCSVSPYSFGNIHNHEERRKRKLLAHKREIRRITALIQEKGLTCIPLSLYLKNGLIKLKIAIGRGKKIHDKREVIKEREDKRSISRAIKQHM
jgi:SsrA-binding protein